MEHPEHLKKPAKAVARPVAKANSPATVSYAPNYKDQCQSTVRPAEVRTVPLVPPNSPVYAPSDAETARVSDGDVNRLSFYLHCIDNECGLHLIKQKELLDHPSAHRLPNALQDAIFQLAYTVFREDFIVGKVANNNNPQSVAQGSHCRFFDVDPACKVEVLTLGYFARATKTMVCGESFMKDFYFDPLDRNIFRACPAGIVKTAETLPTSLSILLDESKLIHCLHCTGSDGVCTCTHGCDAKPSNRCHVEHVGVYCEGCAKASREPIKGHLYKCVDCYEANLCSDCYNSGKHDLNHSFAYISRVGSNPAILWPRSKLSRWQTS